MRATGAATPTTYRSATPIRPIQFGADQEHGLRPGTENVPHIVALGEAARLARTMLAQEAVNTAFQLAVAFAIALFAWALAGSRRAGFFRFIGLYSPGAAGWRAGLVAAALLVPATIALFLMPELRELATADNTVAGAISREGFSTEIVAVIVIVALVKTALAEEIVFRGVIAKTLIRWFSFWPGAALHALRDMEDME